MKGAYWDAETVTARAHGWPVPVYEHKGDTDANYERCTRRLLEQSSGRAPSVHPAFASHNVRSIAHAIAMADDLGLPRPAPLPDAARHGRWTGRCRALGPQVDVYAPIGDLVPGMSYLVRRLLENSSNESFVRQTTRHLDESTLLAAPVPSQPGWWRRRDARDELPPYAPEPVRRWHDAAERAAFHRAVEKQAAAAHDLEVPAVLAGRRIATEDRLVSVDPGRIEHVVATSSAVDTALADQAVTAGAAWAAARGRAGWRARRCRGVDAVPATSWPPSWSSRPASHGRRRTPTSARRSTSASSTPGRRCASTVVAPSVPTR